ncbi:MAG TPA: hypothetical protein VLQ45_29270 [Thermoanaerobaculia bacterium]|nr:hypothetical protein [Thermoanaerobaculia bacterium]
MKKNLRKLTLSRETLRDLESSALGVAGAGNTRQCPSQGGICTGNTCDCTLGCTQAVCTTQ